MKVGAIKERGGGEEKKRRRDCPSTQLIARLREGGEGFDE